MCQFLLLNDINDLFYKKNLVNAAVIYQEKHGLYIVVMCLIFKRENFLAFSN